MPGLELHLKLGLEQPTLPMDVAGEPVESGAWLVRKMMGNKNREGRRNPQLLVSGKTTHMEVLDLKLYPGKGSLTQKSGSSEVLCWSRHRKVHLLYRAV